MVGRWRWIGAVCLVAGCASSQGRDSPGVGRQRTATREGSAPREAEPGPTPSSTAGSDEATGGAHCRLVTPGVADVCQAWGEQPVERELCGPPGGVGGEPPGETMQEWGEGPCPLEGRLGGCEMSGATVFHYRSAAVPDATASMSERACVLSGGRWTTDGR